MSFQNSNIEKNLSVVPNFSTINKYFLKHVKNTVVEKDNLKLHMCQCLQSETDNSSTLGRI